MVDDKLNVPLDYKTPRQDDSFALPLLIGMAFILATIFYIVLVGFFFL